MTVHTDAFFAMGRQHDVCQDYAAAGPQVVVLSDGCSSSPHTDFGARLLCRMAVRTGPMCAAQRAGSLLQPLGLPAEALDATLLSARWVPQRRTVDVYIAGDGVIVGRRRGGECVTVVSHFSSDAPLYPSYGLDVARRERYLCAFDGVRTVTTTATGRSPLVCEEPVADATAHLSFDFPASDFDLVLLLSDGAQSFRRTVSGRSEVVPLEEVVEAMIAVKGFAGAFITRRAKRFLKECTARGCHHDDDFSVAALYLEAL